MAKTKQFKEQAITELASGLKEAKSAVFANFQGLTVAQSEELRGKCREQNITYVASKKTLLRRALSEMGQDVDTKAFDGGVAVVLGLEDEVAPAQVIANYAKNNEMVKIFGGVLEGNFIGAEKVTELSKLPSKQELYAKLVGSLNSPVSGFVNVLAGNLRGLVNVLGAIKDTKAESDSIYKIMSEETTATVEQQAPAIEAATTEEKKDVEVPAKFKGLVEEIEKMSVLDLSELVSILEDKFGVSAAAPAMMMAGPAMAGGEAASAVEEKTEFNVELTDVGSNKIAVIKAVKAATGLGLADAKGLVDGAPATIKEGVKKEEAEALKASIEEAGGKAELK